MRYNINMERILVINPGSGSTKIAVYDGETELFSENYTHSPGELEACGSINGQYGLRLAAVLRALEDHGIDPGSLDAIAARGGLLAPIKRGAYRIGELMVDKLRHRPEQQHASNLAAQIAYELSLKWNIPSYIYDGITNIELDDIQRVTGLPGIERDGKGHALNTRAAALRYAQGAGAPYESLNLIVAHLGSGITINLHRRGRLADSYSDAVGPFSTLRAGGIPSFDLVDLCFREGQTKASVEHILKYEAGLYAHLGSSDIREVEKRIAAGDGHAKLIYDAMCLNISKNLARAAVSVKGDVDQIILTGGMAHSSYITDTVADHVSFIAPVTVYPGEFEMQALAYGILRVLRGEEPAREYSE